MTRPDDEARPDPPTGGEVIKKKLAGWFQKAVQGSDKGGDKGGDKGAAPPAAGASPAARPCSGLLGTPPARPGSGPLAASPSGPLGPAAKPAPMAASGPLNRPGAASSLRLPGAGPAPSGSGLLPPAEPTAAPAAEAPQRTDPEAPTQWAQPAADVPPARTRAAKTGDLPGDPPAPATRASPTRPAAEDPATASRRRMAFIVAYMKDPTSDPDFNDKPLVYRILSEERAYQQSMIGTLQEDLRRLAMAPPDNAEAAERREELDARLKTAQNRQSQLFLQLKKLTGVKGKTGGTGFLVATDLPPGPPVLPPKPAGPSE